MTYSKHLSMKVVRTVHRVTFTQPHPGFGCLASDLLNDLLKVPGGAKLTDMVEEDSTVTLEFIEEKEIDK
jgi:hypothetical protein